MQTLNRHLLGLIVSFNLVNHMSRNARKPFFCVSDQVRWLEGRKIRFKKKRDCTIRVV